MMKSVHIYGLNAHGISAVRLAQRMGLAVTASDLNTEPEFAARVRGQLSGLPLFFGEHPGMQLTGAEYVVVSPGVVQNPQMWRQVRTTPNWISVADFTCAVNHWPNPKIIITGTYGKTTLCTLLQSYLKQVGKSVLVAGNYEQPISSLQPENGDDYLVFELDYQQLVAAKTLRAEAGVILNIEPGDDVFGSTELYVKTKLSVAGLLKDTAPAFVTAEVMKLAEDRGLGAGPWVLPAAVAPLDCGLIPLATASILSALLAELKLPPIARHEWPAVAALLPRGRCQLVPVSAKLDLVNDGAAKGAAAVAQLVEKLATMANAILITNCPQAIPAGVQVVPLADDGAQSLDNAVQCALDLAGSAKAVVAYSPGVATVGSGFQSILHRIDLFERFARQYSRPR